MFRVLCPSVFFLSFFRNTRQIPLHQRRRRGEDCVPVGKKKKKKKKEQKRFCVVVVYVVYVVSVFVLPREKKASVKVCSHQWGNIIIIIISFLISSKLSRWNNTHTIEEECSKRRLRRGLASREIGKGREIQQGTQSPS